MFPAFDNSPGSFLDLIAENKSLRIDFVHQVFEPPEFETGNNGEDDVAIIADIIFAWQKAPLAFVNSNATTQPVDQLIFDDFTFA